MGTEYRYMELWLFDTCNFLCGYCLNAETGAVLDSTQLNFYKSRENLDRLISFFNIHSGEGKKWLVSFTGGEPFLAPNLSYLVSELIRAGHRTCFYTNLSIPLHHKNYSWINHDTARHVDYFMCSFHPEWLSKEKEFFDRVSQLKTYGVNPIVRFVGHPTLLMRLETLEEYCNDIGVTFYPTTLFTKRYPKAYTNEEKTLLSKFMKGYSSLVQLEGGLDVSSMRCKAGSSLFASNISAGGDITPCISTDSPIIGNILRNELTEFHKEVACFKKDKVCSCDVHFQQDIVIGASDSKEFALIENGMGRSCIANWEKWKDKRNLKTTDKFFAGQGGVSDDSILIFDKSKVKARLRRASYKKAAFNLIEKIVRREGT